MKINNNNEERVEVMALFGYAMTPCRPLTFKRRGEEEIEVSELLKTQVRFIGNSAKHIFDVVAEHGDVYRLIFDSNDLSWYSARV